MADSGFDSNADERTATTADDVGLTNADSNWRRTLADVPERRGLDFKTAAFIHSATPPRANVPGFQQSG